MTLSFFIIIFSISLDKRERAQDCEKKGLIENIDNLNPAIVTIDKYILLIVGLLFSMPVLFFCFYKFKKSQNFDDEFTKPFLETKEDYSTIKPSYEVTEKSLTLKFKPVSVSPLIVTEQMDKIGVSANWNNGYLRLELRRGENTITSQNLFGTFDSSMNQTDRVLTKDNCELIREAQPGDQLVIVRCKTSYILNMRVELLDKDEEHKPLWKYTCPNGHPLKVFYGEGK